MEQPTKSPMERLAVTSRRLQAAVLVFMALTPCAVAFGALTGAWSELLNMPREISLDTSRISGMGLIAAVAVGSIKPAAYMAAFWFLYKLLGLYREGVVFAAANVAAIRRIGWALVGIDVAALVQTVVAGPVLAAFRITERHVSVRLGVAFLAVGLFMVLVARVMDLGRELKEQDSLVI